jgi:hypothetical protein
MVTSIRTRKIARSTVRRVKRNKLSKNVRRMLKRKVSKRKVMKGGASHFDIYFVYFSETKGLLTCSNARFRMNVVGLLFYSKVNGDSFYFGYDQFGYVNCDIFSMDKYKIFTPQNKELDEHSNVTYRTGPILVQDLAFISWLCGLPMTDSLITQLESQINNNGILQLLDNNVLYCVNLNKKLIGATLELGYAVKETKTEYASDSVYDDETKTTTKLKINNVGNIVPIPPKERVFEGEIEIKIDDDTTFYFYLELRKQTNEISRSVSVESAILNARSIMTQEINYTKNQVLDDYNKTYSVANKQAKLKNIRGMLDNCLKLQPQQPQQPQQSQQPNTVN